MDSQMKPTISQSDSELTLRPGVDITASNVGEIRSQMKAMITDGTMKLTIDLTDVTVIDSSGIGLLVAAHNSLSRHGGKLHVINASGELVSLFKAFRLDRHFTIIENSAWK